MMRLHSRLVQMIDDAFSCGPIRGLARLGRFRAASPRPGVDDLVSSIV
jgi:hypothetical protein